MTKVNPVNKVNEVSRADSPTPGAARPNRSPLDIPGIETDITTDEILASLREDRERGDRLAGRRP